MPHIHTGENEHDLTVSAYIARTDTDEPKVLVHMHKKLGRLLAIGGHVELLETPWQALAHELEEESGYSLDQLQVLQPSSRIKKLSKVALHPYPLAVNTHSIPQTHFHTDLEYGFVTTTDPSHAIGAGESLDLRWYTQVELNGLDSSLIYDNTKEIYNFLFEEALPNWEKVNTDEYLLDFPEEYKD